MPEAPNRRVENKARALLNNTGALIARASAHLLHGDSLDAMRLLKAAGQLDDINSRLRSKRAADKRERAARDTTASTLRSRENDCKFREERVILLDRQLRADLVELKETEASINATYQLMRNGELDGPARATGELTDLGVAPI